MTEIEELVADLQSRLAFQDDTIQQLNDVLVKQDECIRKLDNEVIQIKQQLFSLRDELSSRPSDSNFNEKPPHY